MFGIFKLDPCLHHEVECFVVQPIQMLGGQETMLTFYAGHVAANKAYELHFRLN